MEIPIYQVDAFASEPFQGNPAAVCPLHERLPYHMMQNIAAENNLSETAFFTGQDGEYQLRWFTPTVEVDLCGHATLASAHVLYEHLEFDQELIRFDTNSGRLEVQKNGEFLEMDFPVAVLNAFDPPPELEEALGISAVDIYKDTDILYVVEDKQQVRALDPDYQLLRQVNTRGVIVTAPAEEGEEADFVSRFFAPAAGIDEDPVTGSAHTMLTPYWSTRLGKQELVGRQISKRGGTVFCKTKGSRVALAGKAHTYMKGEIRI